MVAQKAKLLLENAITPIVCLDTPYLDEQIKDLFRNDVDVSHCYFVYEPVSAVGTGRPVNPTDAGHVANQISFLLDNSAPVLYGGSVTGDNVSGFLDQPTIAGVLVGTDSLEPTLFADIINRIN
jgi:triosephosphate isomerase